VAFEVVDGPAVAQDEEAEGEPGADQRRDDALEDERELDVEARGRATSRMMPGLATVG
jgi:hypothetical protein